LGEIAGSTLEEERARAKAVRVLKDALAPGSYLVVSHATPDDVPDGVSEATKGVYASASAQVTPRPLGQVARFFEGLELIDPGVVNVADWRPGLPPGRPSRVLGKSLVYGGIAVKRHRS
jgi:hypothetical protein